MTTERSAIQIMENRVMLVRDQLRKTLDASGQRRSPNATVAHMKAQECLSALEAFEREVADDGESSGWSAV